MNVIAYYSTSIFENAGYSRSEALLVSLGTGAVNFLFAIPAIYTIGKCPNTGGLWSAELTVYN